MTKNDIKKNILSLKQKIQEYELRYHRPPGSVRLLAATKNQSIEKIEQAITANQFCFGESYLQEALPKINALQNKNIEWHFIGPIQRNKTKKIAEHFNWVQSVDQFIIAKRLSEQRPPHLPPLNICLEINISGEASKHGVLPNEILELAKNCAGLSNLHLRGLMAIPAPKKNFLEQKNELAKLKMIFDGLCKQGFKLDTLSMGMSDDLEAAIAEGATMVRIGTAIFGAR